MMMLSQMAAVLNAQLIGPDVLCNSVGADSRAIQEGQLFVALKGERFDGHAFAQHALNAGAAAVLVNASANLNQSLQPVLVVDDTYAALGQLAQHWRKQMNVALIAITGSNGKTTVKEMLASILQAASGPSQVLATQGNLNNHIGMPMTLLKLTPEHQFAVIEMGMNHTGEIAYLSQIAAPNVALINNAGSAHIGELGSLEAIAQAKGEIFIGLAQDGIAIINADDTFAPLWLDLTPSHRHLRFGLQVDAEVSASYTLHAEHSALNISTPLGHIAFTLPAPGLHNVYNALAATCAAIAVNVPLTSIQQGLQQYQGVKGRLQTVDGINGAVIIDDTYNANLVSMKAAIDVLAAKSGKKWLVLGDIGELGENAAAMHAEVGLHASQAKIDGVFTLGQLSQNMTDAFNQANLAQQNASNAQHFTDLTALIAALQPHLHSSCTILVKGSRFMAMERVVQALQKTVNHTHTSAETH